MFLVNLLNFPIRILRFNLFGFLTLEVLLANSQKEITFFLFFVYYVLCYFVLQDLQLGASLIISSDNHRDWLCIVEHSQVVQQLERFNMVVWFIEKVCLNKVSLISPFIFGNAVLVTCDDSSVFHILVLLPLPILFDQPLSLCFVELRDLERITGKFSQNVCASDPQEFSAPIYQCGFGDVLEHLESSFKHTNIS